MKSQNHAFVLSLLAWLAFPVPTAWAQTILNPSFELDHYYVSPGYASVNGGVITGWAISDATRIGLNLGGTFTGTGSLLAKAPLLAPLGNYGGPTPTLPPLSGSPAIDAGNSAVDTAIHINGDQRGYPRISGARVDIGAVEAQYAPANNPPVLKNPVRSSAGGGGGTFQFTFTNSAHIDFTALTSTNLALPLTNWSVVGNIPEISPGVYQFTDTGETISPQRYYRVTSP